MITVDLENGYSESFATMREAREALIAADAAGESGAIVADGGEPIRLGSPEWMAWAAGEEWAEREWEAHPDPVASGAWRASAIDARPLVDDRDLADVVAAAATARWNEMLAAAEAT